MPRVDGVAATAGSANDRDVRQEDADRGVTANALEGDRERLIAAGWTAT